MKLFDWKLKIELKSIQKKKYGYLWQEFIIITSMRFSKAQLFILPVLILLLVSNSTCQEHLSHEMRPQQPVAVDTVKHDHQDGDRQKWNYGLD